jgi:hypothetical protein
MIMSRLKHVHLVLTIGISLFILPPLAYSLSDDLSDIVLVSSDMSFENIDGEELSTCQNEFELFVPPLSSNPLPLGALLGLGSGAFSSPLTPNTQITAILRC